MTLKANLTTDSDFLGWYENGTLLSSNVNYSFTIKGNRNIEARFKVVYFTVKMYLKKSMGIGSCLSQGYTEFRWERQIKRGELISLQSLGGSNLNYYYFCGFQIYRNNKFQKIETKYIVSNDETIYESWNKDE